ncbi:hypothetical protein D3C71_1766830 [compost metagenome]
MVTMIVMLITRRMACSTGVWIAPEQISQPYHIRPIVKHIDTNGRIFAVTEATIGVMTLVSIVVTD